MSGVETYQNTWEFETLLHLVDEMWLENVLEVGAYEGGTLYHWIRRAPNVVVVDDQMRGATRWENWAEYEKCNLALLQGDSHDPRVVEIAKDLGPYDLVFIDADHTFESVKADWDNYSSLGKVVVLHDILPRPGYGVSELWSMIKQGERRWVEICHNATLPGNEGPCGIGVVWMA